MEPLVQITAGDSLAQRNAEEVTLALLSDRLGVPLAKRRFALPNGGWLEVDAASESPPLLCEIWAHQGPPKSAQKAKVMTDAMKLVYARSLLPAEADRRIRLLLVFADDRAAAHFRGTSWMAEALKAEDIEITVVELPELVRLEVERAQEVQYR
jgi:hypothetical protein